MDYIIYNHFHLNGHPVVSIFFSVGIQYNTLSILSLCAGAFVSKTTVVKLLIAFRPELL